MTQGSDNNQGIQAIDASLPTGGGAIKGMGENFESGGFTGTASLNIPILSSPCRGIEPQLAASYSSSNGNGEWGLGLDVLISSVSRKTSKGIPYGANIRTSRMILLLGNITDNLFVQ